MSALLAGASTLSLLLLVLRRIVLERARRIGAEKEKQFDQLLSAIVYQRIDADPTLLPSVTRDEVAPLVKLLLSYLRNLVGPDAQRIIGVVAAWNIEDLIRAEARHARRGRRILALTLLSYLPSASSLEEILEALQCRDPYIQLAAVRCLARRGASWALPDIVVALDEGRLHNPVLLADALQRFGPAGLPQLERLAVTSKNDAIRAATLEAIALIAPEQIALDLGAFTSSDSERVRAAAVKLSGQAETAAGGDLVAQGAQDPSARVRAEAALSIGSAGRAEQIGTLCRLLEDHDWWVRYQAARAMMALGAQGRAVMRSLAGSSNARSADLARAVIAEAEQA